MPEKKKKKKLLLRILSVLGLLILIGIIYILIVSKTNPPKISDEAAVSWQIAEPSPGFYILKNNWFRKSKSGLFELYVEGAPFERGVVNGKLSKELIQLQEDYFNDQINKMIPSRFYRHFLKYVIGWFNRDLDKHVSQEDKEEIYGISLSASDQYAYIGNNYQRILNYHAAHDIGHALQTLPWSAVLLLEPGVPGRPTVHSLSEEILISLWEIVSPKIKLYRLKNRPRALSLCILPGVDLLVWFQE